MVDLHLPSNVWLRDGRTVLALPGIEYGGLLDAMFHQIRQNAAGDASVLIRLLEVLTAVASREKNPDRVDELSRHAELVLADAERDVPTEADRVDLRGRHGYFHAMRKHGPRAAGALVAMTGAASAGTTGTAGRPADAATPPASPVASAPHGRCDGRRRGDGCIGDRRRRPQRRTGVAAPGAAPASGAPVSRPFAAPAGHSGSSP